MRTVEVIIDTQGNTAVETKGFTGSACRAASAEIEKALGAVTAEKLTSEAFQSETKTEHQKQENGGSYARAYTYGC